MALIDEAVINAAVGYVFRAPVGTAKPTPDELDSVDPERFGCQVLNVKVSGSPTTYKLKQGATDTTADLDLAASADAVTSALEALPSIGAGNVIVEGVSAGDAAGLTITVSGALQSKTLTLTGTATGGTSPAVDVEVVKAPNGWRNVGHTSRDDMPEFGFDGGDTEVKGTWQKKRLREIATGDPVADSVTINLSQWDADSLELYYGEDAAPDEDGVFGVSGDFEPIECAVLIIIVDGSVRIGFYAPKASVKRDDSVNLPVDDLASLPIKVTFLNLGARRLYDWISKALFKKS
ncbi:phage tail tube protein [Mycobacterium intracellulare]|uniref:Phage tail protein n=1 Tax=Mycobacterium intracellulare TaxID=1767 RepID=A0AAE4R7G8_MYCIT|nr:phage tail protein [Mycobacterium intracellulare]MDV6975338.1 phage tail protein [Mycobacterium intracellulare]MDV6980402.1 phage tail protein [Mycobacterium intracellulare]MDV7010831.1 phage tail protein [Mycobacterium intracellulare]MDV7025737.1 phage tail protein [Mycobacterium intracellulare]